LPVAEVGELTTQMKKLEGAPGSLNGTGLLQSLIALKLREIYQSKHDEAESKK